MCSVFIFWCIDFNNSLSLVFIRSITTLKTSFYTVSIGERLDNGCSSFCFAFVCVHASHSRQQWYWAGVSLCSKLCMTSSHTHLTVTSFTHAWQCACVHMVINNTHWPSASLTFTCYKLIMTSSVVCLISISDDWTSKPMTMLYLFSGMQLPHSYHLNVFIFPPLRVGDRHWFCSVLKIHFSWWRCKSYMVRLFVDNSKKGSKYKFKN